MKIDHKMLLARVACEPGVTRDWGAVIRTLRGRGFRVIDLADALSRSVVWVWRVEQGDIKEISWERGHALELLLAGSADTQSTDA